jgi:hypothetical protein
VQRTRGNKKKKMKEAEKKASKSMRRVNTGTGVDLMQRWQQQQQPHKKASPLSPKKNQLDDGREKDKTPTATATTALMVPLMLLWQDPAPLPRILTTAIRAFAALRLTK